MAIFKEGITENGESMRYSVGAVIKRNEKYLLIDRKKPPLGFASLAGHVDKGEDPLTAIKREVREESSLEVTTCKQLFEEEIPSEGCSCGVRLHHWVVFECDVTGEPKQDIKEAKSMEWYTVDQIKQLHLEPAWKHWFKKLKIIE